MRVKLIDSAGGEEVEVPLVTGQEKWPYARATTEAEREAYTAGYTAGRDGEAKVARSLESKEAADASRFALGDAPVIALTAKNYDVNFADNRLKIGVAGVISDHTPVPNAYTFECSCKKIFDSRTEWSNHVRKRIWRYMKNDFPAIGTEDEGS